MPKYLKRREDTIAKRTRTKLGSTIERRSPTQYPAEWYFSKKMLATRNQLKNKIKARKLGSQQMKRPKLNKVSRKVIQMTKIYKNINSNALHGNKCVVKNTYRTALIRSKKRVSTKKTTNGKQSSVKKIKSKKKTKKVEKRTTKAKKEKEDKSEEKPDYWEALEMMAERDRRRVQVAAGPSVAEDALDTLHPTDATSWHHAYSEATSIWDPLYPDIRCRSLASNPEVTSPVWDGLSRETEKLAEADPGQRKMDTDSGGSNSEDEANVNNNKRKARKTKRKKKKQKGRAKGKTARKGKKKGKQVKRKKGAKVSKSSKPSKSSMKQRKVAKKGKRVLTKTKAKSRCQRSQREPVKFILPVDPPPHWYLTTRAASDTRRQIDAPGIPIHQLGRSSIGRQRQEQRQAPPRASSPLRPSSTRPASKAPSPRPSRTPESRTPELKNQGLKTPESRQPGPRISTPTQTSSQQPSPSPSPSPNHQPPPPQPKSPEERAFAIISGVVGELESLEAQVNGFQGNKNDKDFMYLEEMLTRTLIKLDAVDAGGMDHVREARRELVRRINAALDLLDRAMRAE